MGISTSLNTSVPARDIGYGVVQAIVATVNYNTPGIGTTDTVKVGALPAGAVILEATVQVKTAFNAASTNVLTVGTSSGSDADIISAGDVDEGQTGSYTSAIGADLTFSSDTAVYAKYTQSGTAATAGQAVVVIIYVAVNNG